MTTSIDVTLMENQRLRTILKEKLKWAQQRMVDLANTHTTDKQFAIGDMVYLRLKDSWQ